MVIGKAISDNVQSACECDIALKLIIPRRAYDILIYIRGLTQHQTRTNILWRDAPNTSMQMDNRTMRQFIWNRFRYIERTRVQFIVESINLNYVIVVCCINSPPRLIQNFCLSVIQRSNSKYSVKLIPQLLRIVICKFLSQNLEIVARIRRKVELLNEMPSQPLPVWRIAAGYVLRTETKPRSKKEDRGTRIKFADAICKFRHFTPPLFRKSHFA